MRTVLAAFISAASFFGFASAASALLRTPISVEHGHARLQLREPTFRRSRRLTGAATSFPATVFAGAPAGYAPSGYAPGYGPVGAIIAAPFDMAGTVVTAPFGAVGAGTPVYSYGSQVPPPHGAIGYCDKISGNMICMP